MMIAFLFVAVDERPNFGTNGHDRCAGFWDRVCCTGGQSGKKQAENGSRTRNRCSSIVSEIEVCEHLPVTVSSHTRETARTPRSHTQRVKYVVVDRMFRGFCLDSPANGECWWTRTGDDRVPDALVIKIQQWV